MAPKVVDRQPKAGDRVVMRAHRMFQLPRWQFAFGTIGTVEMVDSCSLYIKWGDSYTTHDYSLSRLKEGMIGFLEEPDDWIDELIVRL